MKYNILAVLFIFLISQSSHANISDCSHEQTNSAMKNCSVTAYEIARKDLNKSYKQFVDKCSGGDEKDRATVILRRLKESQDAWSKFLDVNCSFEAATMLNGSGESLVLTECLGRMTRSRIVELKQIMEEMC